MTPKALKRKMTIMIADDHTLVIEGLRALINREFDMEVIATVTSGKDLLDELQYTRPDLVVLDVQMQGYDGFQCLAEIRQRALPLKVVISCPAHFASVWARPGLAPRPVPRCHPSIRDR